MRAREEQVEQGKMPQWYYLLLHPDAKLSVNDREMILEWVKQPFPRTEG